MTFASSLPEDFVVPHTLQEVGGGVAIPRWKSDEKLSVEFYTMEVYNEFRTKESKRIEYDTVEMVKIVNPSDRFAVECHIVEEYDKMRFPLEYQLFKKGKNQIVGTLIETAPFVSANQVAKLKHLGIKTLEQLERLGVTEQMQIGIDGKELKENAAKYLNTQREMKRLRDSVEEKQDILSEIEKVRQELEALKKQKETLEKKK